MPINETYRTWIRRICKVTAPFSRELRPKQRKTQVQNFIWLLVGLFHSPSVSLSKIAGMVISTAKTVSTVRRLSRFPLAPPARAGVASSAVDVRTGYRSTAKAWFVTQAQQVGEIRLIVDGTKIGSGYQLLMVSLAYRRRAVPIAWCWIRHVRGHSSAAKQIILLKHVRSLIPQEIPVFLVGDSEFGSIAVLQQLTQWRWFFVLRQKGNLGLWGQEQTGWQRLDRLVQKAGQSAWCPNGYLTQTDIFPVSVLIHWQKGEKEPWCLATNLPDASLTLRYYRKRMWIEEMFADFKKHGFDLESTMLRNTPRLSRLTLAVAFLYVWLLSVGRRTIRSGRRHLVDRKDRRDLSLFQIGLRFINRCLLHSHPFALPLYSP